MDFEKAILIPMQEDGLDLYRKEYNNMFLDNQAIVQVAASQEGKGGTTYWSWYGFSSRVDMECRHIKRQDFLILNLLYIMPKKRLDFEMLQV